MPQRTSQDKHCPMCCYSENLPPLRMKPLRELVAHVRQVELISGEYIIPGDEPDFGYANAEPWTPDMTMTARQMHLAGIHHLTRNILDWARSEKRGLVLMPMTEEEAREWRNMRGSGNAD